METRRIREWGGGSDNSHIQIDQGRREYQPPKKLVPLVQAMYQLYFGSNTTTNTNTNTINIQIDQGRREYQPLKKLVPTVFWFKYNHKYKYKYNST